MAFWEAMTAADMKVLLDRREEPAPQDAAPGPVSEEQDEDALLKQQELEHRRAECERPCGENGMFRSAFQLIRALVWQIILTGAPGTGKTYAAGLAAENMGMGWTMPGYREKPKAGREVWKREPSYPWRSSTPLNDYTGFVEGLRPVEMDQKPAFVKLDGSFKAFCRQVAEQNKAGAEHEKENLYFLLIDVINRADLSKVFGELMFCLEADKRGRPVQTQYRSRSTCAVDRETGPTAPLPRKDDFADGFFIPGNVVILGAMNDIDRSVESMGFAPRCRFEWREVEMTDKLLTQAFQSGGFGPCLQENAGGTVSRIMALNRVISGEGGWLGLNRHYYISISQGQFAHLPDTQRDGGDPQILKGSGSTVTVRQYVGLFKYKGERVVPGWPSQSRSVVLQRARKNRRSHLPGATRPPGPPPAPSAAAGGGPLPAGRAGTPDHRGLPGDERAVGALPGQDPVPGVPF